MSVVFCHTRALHTRHFVPVPHAAVRTWLCQRTCSLGKNGLGEGGAGLIADALEENTTLRDLE